MHHDAQGSAIGSNGFRPRQSSYLRISATAVLQMILYLEPAHVDWMNNSVLERMLFALKDRIPLKLQQEGQGKSKGKEKTHVDVFRGADYQMAFFFRRSGDKHVVLLKDKHVTYTIRAPISTAATPAPHDSSTTSAPAARSKRTRTASVDIRDSPPLSVGQDEPASKRRALFRNVEGTGGPEDDDVIVVKDEPVDEGEGLPPNWAEGAAGEAEVKPEIDQDVKPTLKVHYRGFNIFGRTLVVIVEPYPPLDPKDLARPRLLNTEIRQLSASVAPESYRQSLSARPLARSRGLVSVTPAPGGGGLFRSESESVRGSVAPSDVGEGEEDEQMRQLKEVSIVLANEWDGLEDEEGLPSLDQVIARSRGQGNAKGAALEVDGDEPDGSM
ncbi:hypothetical protein Rt10032_c19g6242 [Rhodotorula toruloides]|uniref:Uncharacterized protein n=1 Tax=Rhodotorula toruloides TaxID=5286 RepID=A0A511KQN9_RHOTO|nr:hypothetical protein Rt10032_c19g6242 [Rhodotorula toruloides]